AYKWVIPAKVQGTWRLGDKQLVLTQKYQMVEGTLREEGAATAIGEGRIDGTKISFVAGQQLYTGEISGKTMQGTVEGGGRWSAT
ncbi:hypothetical protein, partial [Acinetobacter baumannii]|uniref:hypothetical protein n=1 Tax=Acinetobacter baumannii TaxID=470 RepID=UPI000BCD5150